MDYVYLCGPINDCSDSECSDWRTDAKDGLRFPTLDPMRRDYRGREAECVNEIIAGDLADMRASRLLLVNHPKPSTGTDMEICIAFREMGKVVVTVVPPDAKPSPWLIGHSTVILRSMESAIAWINGFKK